MNMNIGKETSICWLMTRTGVNTRIVRKRTAGKIRELLRIMRNSWENLFILITAINLNEKSIQSINFNRDFSQLK